jgi:hypothetical protein
MYLTIGLDEKYFHTTNSMRSIASGDTRCATTDAAISVPEKNRLIYLI